MTTTTTTWRKNPNDFQTDNGAVADELPPPIAAAASGDAATIATLPRDDDDNDGDGKERKGATTTAPSSSSSTHAVPPPSSPVRNNNTNNTNSNTNTSNNHHHHLHDGDTMSQLTTPSEIDPSDALSQTSATPTSATAAAAALTRLSTNVKEVLSDTLQILQGVPPPSRGINNNNSQNNNNNNINGNGDGVPEHFIMMTPNQEDEIRVDGDVDDMDDDDDDLSIDFLQDNVNQMTFGRRIAMALINSAWYNPSINAKAEALEDAKEHPETSIITTPNNNKNKNNNNNSINNNSIQASTLHTTPAANNNSNNNNNSLLLSTSRHSTSSRRGQRPAEPPSVTALEYPSLAKAWAYFEHVTLPRYFIPERDPDKARKNILVRCIRRIFCKGNQSLDRAEPGENSKPTKLYSPIFTPLKQMGDFGLGIGLYFSTLRAMMLLTFFAGLICTPNFKFFLGPNYTVDGQEDVLPLLKGSAICSPDSQLFVPCPNCTTDAKGYILSRRLANATVIITDPNTLQEREEIMTFALRNFCFGATLQQGFVNYGALIFFLVGILWLNYYLQKMEVKFDEDEQTAQDYSMVITNPPADATSPQEWKEFLERNFTNCHVTVCTVAVDNDILVRSLVERREKMKRIEMLVDPGTRLDDISLSNIAARTERNRRWYQHVLAMFAPGIPELYGRVVVLNAKVQGLAQQEYPASNVFVSFETEQAQRQVLATLSVGSLAAKRNDGRVLPDPKYLFRGHTVLEVEEAEEPNTIRWEDLNAPFWERMKALFWTTFATLCAIVLIAFIVYFVNDSAVTYAAFTIAIFNSVFPMFAKILTNLEAHPTEGHKQTSLYFKIALFRWVNTAIVYTIIRPFTETLDISKGIIPSIYAQFLAEIITSNAIQLLDPVGHLQRHFLAPRAKSQDAMNLNMQGQTFELAERYTNMTKILFLAMWYCAIYPAAFFMCSFALLVIFFVDRFSLFRTWKPAPNLGTSISRFSRNYFFSLAVVAMAVVSSYYWSAFPFDNLCQDSPVSSYIIIKSIIRLSSTKERKITVPLSKTETNFNYRFCHQDLIRSDRVKVFPFTSMSQPKDNKWMTPDQKTLTDVYGWTSVAVVGIVILSFLWRWAQSLQGLFKSTYEPCGEDQLINFSDVPSMNTYIPQVKSSVFSYPLLATNITGLDTTLLEWTDPDREFEFYDLTKDAERLLRGHVSTDKVVFSQVKHWPPASQLKKSKKASVSLTA